MEEEGRAVGRSIQSRAGPTGQRAAALRVCVRGKGERVSASGEGKTGRGPRRLVEKAEAHALGRERRRRKWWAAVAVKGRRPMWWRGTKREGEGSGPGREKGRKQPTNKEMLLTFS